MVSGSRPSRSDAARRHDGGVTADAPALETSARAHAASSLAAVLAGAATWGLSAASPLVAWPIDTSPLAARGSFVLAFGWVAAEVLTLAWLTRGASPARLGVSALVATAALAAIAVLRAPPSPPIIALVAAILLAGGSSAGALVGSRIQHPGHLGVVAVVSSVADIVSVFHESGPTAQLAESTPWLSLFAIGAPMLGTSDVPPLLGVGDVVMAALYATAAARFALPEKRTWMALTGGLASAMVAVLVLEIALPALPFLGLAMVVAHPETRLPPHHERPQAALGIALVAAAAAWILSES
jgi:hypothetical protein